MDQIDFTGIIDLLTSGDGMLIAVAAGLALLIIGFKLAGKRVPVLGVIADKLLQLVKLGKKQPMLKGDEKGAEEVIELKKLK